MNNELKYLKYKNKYINLKKQIGGQRSVNIYNKNNYKELLFKINLDDGDDLEVLKYKIIAKMNEKEHIFSGGIDKINIFQHANFCVEPKLNGITDTMNNFCMSINNSPDFSPIKMQSGLVPSVGKISITNTDSEEIYPSILIVEGSYGNFDGTVKKGYYHYHNGLTHIDLEEGTGMYKTIGITLIGTFIHNKLTGIGEKRLYKQCITKEYRGTFINNNLIDGKITIYGTNRIILEKHHGQFDNEENIIQGSITRENGQIETGTFKENLLEGQGNIQYPDGKIESGNYSKGVLKK